MPKGMGYHGGYGKGSGYDKPTSTTSYRDSPAKPPAGSNRHGFSKNPKQKSSGPKTSNPFPRNPGQG